MSDDRSRSELDRDFRYTMGEIIYRIESLLIFRSEMLRHLDRVKALQKMVEDGAPREEIDCKIQILAGVAGKVKDPLEGALDPLKVMRNE